MSTPENQIIQTLRENGTKFVRFVWCDNANVIRSKAVHVAALLDFVNDGVALAVSNQGLPVMHDTLLKESGLGPVGEVRLIPDWTTVTYLPYAPGQARVLTSMVSDGKPWDLCPRSFLLGALADAEREGLQIKAAFESEFYLLRTLEGQITPSDNTVFAETLAMDVNYAFVNMVCEYLQAQNVTVEQYYPESGPGQHEITLRYAAAQEAPDRQIILRETVRAVARSFGLRASFLPKVFADYAGSGCHIHLSLWKDGQNQVHDPKTLTSLSPVARAFIAGVLEHLPGLTALATPTPNSYRRLRPHSWSGAYACWGLNNREAAIRVPANPGERPTNIELRSCDSTANPYLVLGAVITAGMDGVRRELELGEPLSSDPGYLSADELTAKRIIPLPRTLSESIKSLEMDELLMSALGRPLRRAYIAVRKAELSFLDAMSLEEEVKLLAERY